MKKCIYIIFTPGKTGSTSLVKMFKKNCHLHGIENASYESFYLKHDYSKEFDCYQIHEHKVLLYLYEKFNDKYNFKTIILLRNEKQRAVSAFFENIERFINKPRNVILNLCYEEIFDYFLKFRQSNKYGNLTDWISGCYETNILNKDLNQQDFDFYKKYELFTNKYGNGVILRYEDINSWHVILNNFVDNINFDENTFNNNKSNYSNNKWYYELYTKYNNTLINTFDENNINKYYPLKKLL